LDETLMANLKSIQVAIIRGEQETRMHVNQRSVSIDRGTLLLDEYANRPWSNPEKGKSSKKLKTKPKSSSFLLKTHGCWATIGVTVVTSNDC